MDLNRKETMGQISIWRPVLKFAKKGDYHLGLIEYDYILLSRVCIKRVSPFGEEYTNHFGSGPITHLNNFA